MRPPTQPPRTAVRLRTSSSSPQASYSRSTPGRPKTAVTALRSLRPCTGTSLKPAQRSATHSCLGHGRTDERAVPHKP